MEYLISVEFGWLILGGYIWFNLDLLDNVRVGDRKWLEEGRHVLNHLVEFKVHSHELSVRARAAETRCGHTAMIHYTSTDLS